MANFKVGQRVRINAPTSDMNGRTGTVWRILPNGLWRRLLGRTYWANDALAAGINPSETAHLVNVDGFGWGRPGMFIGFASYQLEPLTDPKADAFLESIRKLKPYEEPKVREYLIGGVKWTVTEPDSVPR